MEEMKVLVRGTCSSFAPRHRFLILRGEAAANEDPSQWVLFPCCSDRWTDLQVAKGVKAGDGLEERLSAYVAKIRSLQEEKWLWALPWVCLCPYPSC